MKYLLDTQIFIWSLDEVEKLSSIIRKTLEDSNNSIYISSASAWEISIKQKIGKLRLKKKLKTYIEDSGFEILIINLDHIYFLDNLPLYHRDPFDRILIAQAKYEDLTLITTDKEFKKYQVKIFK